ncbi:uncharacterized protein LOC121876023 [Homarus americanus]|uniref:uncharacterized protein LOC121876023 n=1 Tax=Homarus americanus TaxID=6706 RepID=UPI001C478A1F|nr:uncharacterized protein LOC121876023 [Homarus americanus]
MTCQTVPSYTMDKTTQKSATTSRDNSCMATQWIMYDEYRKTDDRKREDELSRLDTRMEIEYYLGEYQGHMDQQEEQQEEDDVEERVDRVRGVEVSGLLRGLGWVERQLSSNANIHLLHAYTDSVHQTQQQKTRLKPGTETSEWCDSDGEGCRAEELWHYWCEAISGCRVNGVTFCSSSPVSTNTSYT